MRHALQIALIAQIALAWGPKVHTMAKLFRALEAVSRQADRAEHWSITAALHLVADPGPRAVAVGIRGNDDDTVPRLHAEL